MRSLFPGYYPPETAEDSFWREGIFVFDANILLNAYRYSESAKEKLLQAIQSVEERAFLPYQAALEFQRNRVDVIRDRRKKYAEAREFFEKLNDEVAKLSSKDKKGASLSDDLEKAWRMADLEPGLKRAVDYLRECESNILYPSLFDQIRDRIDLLFMGKVGGRPSEEQQKDWHRQAEQRIEKKIPPGFKDSRKEGLGPHGDILVWLQTLECAKERAKPIIFVSDDLKEDWYWEFEGRKIGPRRELVEEMRLTANVDFMLCDCARFIEKVWGILLVEQEGPSDRASVQAVIEEALEVKNELFQFTSRYNIPPFQKILLEDQENEKQFDRIKISKVNPHLLSDSAMKEGLVFRSQFKKFLLEWKEIRSLELDDLARARYSLQLIKNLTVLIPVQYRISFLSRIDYYQDKLDDIRSGQIDIFDDGDGIVSLNEVLTFEINYMLSD